MITETSHNIGPCAKRVVRCTIITPDGRRFIGENWCANPQLKCPREEDEDYTKCRTVCNQWGHAETVAAEIAGPNAIGAHAYVENHSYACRHCQETLFHIAGITALTIGPPPEEK